MSTLNIHALPTFKREDLRRELRDFVRGLIDSGVLLAETPEGGTDDFVSVAIDFHSDWNEFGRRTDELIDYLLGTLEEV